MELSVCLWECHVFVSLFASYGSCSSLCLWELYFHLSIYICSFNCISVGTLCSFNCLCFCGNCMFLFLSACLLECYVLVSIFMSMVVQCSCNCLCVCGNAMFLYLSLHLMKHVLVSVCGNYVHVSFYTRTERYVPLTVYLWEHFVLLSVCVSVGTVCSCFCLRACWNAMFLYRSLCLW
jgi:hypothetical protein